MKTKKALAVILIINLLTWGVVLPVRAATQLSLISDTLSDSNINVLSNHNFSWTALGTLGEASTIEITWPSGFNFFGMTASDVVSATGMTLVTSCGAGADEVTVAVSVVNRTATLTVCADDTLSAGAKTLTVGGANKIQNPSTAGSQSITVVHGDEEGIAMIAILADVSVTVAVGTTFTFTISPKNSGTIGDVGGDLCDDVTATTTTIPFGTMTAGIPKVACQTLAVTTNAISGFTVTVMQDQLLTSANGADINTFKDNGDTAVPEAWVSPSATLGVDTTYGHMGLTSSDLAEFSDGTLYAGNMLAPREVFSNDGPADGATADIGAVNVGYKIEISVLQEAAGDYAANLSYIATPIF
ncbi:hypothetical protein KKB41_04245 [Patescibacteria group bacterium]|nr:hypothetical protein [Patescibacteria group bacterium]